MLTSPKRTLKCKITFYILCQFNILESQNQIVHVTQLLRNRLCEFRKGVKICLRIRGSSFRHYHFLIAVKPTDYPTQRKMQDFSLLVKCGWNMTLKSHLHPVVNDKKNWSSTTKRRPNITQRWCAYRLWLKQIYYTQISKV